MYVYVHVFTIDRMIVGLIYLLFISLLVSYSFSLSYMNLLIAIMIYLAIS